MKPSTLEQLTNRKLLLILTYAPAGLGHLRVTDALYRGLPETIIPVVLGGQDRSIQSIHRLTSVNPAGKAVFDWLQAGPFTSRANELYRNSLRADNHEIYYDIVRLLGERHERPERILVACTHFGLAHKLAAIKTELQEQEHVRMTVAVCITDDTFQHIWHVDGADLLLVPSQPTRRKYIAHGELLGRPTRVEVVPYPIHPRLGAPLNATELAGRRRQLDSASTEPIHISIPISGAAVGTEYFAGLMSSLREKSERFVFHVICKDAPFTSDFLGQLRDKPWIDLRASPQDRQVVQHYDDLMEQHTLAFEVTKPSEQTFKCLAGTRARGGVILLFTQPVGTQEFDNMEFLLRHALVPSGETNDQLWAMAREGAHPDGTLRDRLFEESRSWRGVRIPKDPRLAAEFIAWMHASGIFAQMLEGCLDRQVLDEDGRVLGPDGVDQFWDLAVSV